MVVLFIVFGFVLTVLKLMGLLAISWLTIALVSAAPLLILLVFLLIVAMAYKP